MAETKRKTFYDEAGNHWEMVYKVSSITNDLTSFKYYKNGEQVKEEGSWGGVPGDDAASHQIKVFEEYVKARGEFFTNEKNVFSNDEAYKKWDEVYQFEQEFGTDVSKEDYDKDYQRYQDLGYSNDEAKQLALGLASAEDYETRDETTLHEDKEEAEEEQEGFERELKTSLATAKAEAGDITEREVALAKKDVSTALSESIRSQTDALLSQGYTPEEAQMMVSSGVEGQGRVLTDIVEKGAILKSKTLADLSKFGITTDLNAETLASEMRKIWSTSKNLQLQLRNQLNLGHLSADTSRFGATTSAEASMYGADIGLQGVKAQIAAQPAWWEEALVEAAGGFGEGVGSNIG
jgi:hypothetical protein